MLVTGKPLYVLGIITSVDEPVYPITLYSVPLLINVNSKPSVKFSTSPQFTHILFS